MRKRQYAVERSTTEDRFMEATHVRKEAVWLQIFSSETKKTLSSAVFMLSSEKTIKQ
jgi:hypothetical protein